MGSSRATIVTVLTAALVVGLCLPASGCGARRRARESQSVERMYARTSFVNQSDTSVRVTVVIGERTTTPPGMGSTFTSEPQQLSPGETYQATVQEKKPYGVGFLFPENQDLVVRFKLESTTATWEPAHVAWFEAVGPLPAAIRILPGDGGVPTAISDTGRIEAVPREWWPKE